MNHKVNHAKMLVCPTRQRRRSEHHLCPGELDKQQSQRRDSPRPRGADNSERDDHNANRQRYRDEERDAEEWQQAVATNSMPTGFHHRADQQPNRSHQRDCRENQGTPGRRRLARDRAEPRCGPVVSPVRPEPCSRSPAAATMRKMIDPIPPTPAVAASNAPSAVTRNQANSVATRTVHVMLAASTTSTRVRRSRVKCQHTKAHPGVTHRVTNPTNTAAVVLRPNSAATTPITALPRPTPAVTR